MRLSVFRARRGAVAPLLLLLALGALSGCQRRFSVEEHRVLAAVKGYNQSLPSAYRSGRVDAMEPWTGAEERERLTTLLAGLAQKGWTLDTRQESFALGAIKVEPPPLMADLESSEVWWYRQLGAKSGAEVQPPKRIRYGLRYKLVQTQGHWLVDRIEMLTSENLPAK